MTSHCNLKDNLYHLFFGGGAGGQGGRGVGMLNLIRKGQWDFSRKTLNTPGQGSFLPAENEESAKT